MAQTDKLLAGSVIQGYFCGGYGLPQLSRELQASKKRWYQWSEPAATKNRVCIAVCANGSLLRSYGPGATRRPWVESLFQRFKLLFHKPSNSDVAGKVDLECRSLWGAPPRLRIQHHPEQTMSVEAVAGKLFSALFYVDVCSYPDLSVSPGSCEIEVKCRLAPGNHLNAVTHRLHDQELRVYYRGCGEWHQKYLCLTKWDSQLPFSRRFKVEVLSLESRLELRIDSPTQIGRQENSSNTPCRLRDLVECMAQSHKDGANGLSQACGNAGTKESVNFEDEICQIDSLIEALND